MNYSITPIRYIRQNLTKLMLGMNYSITPIRYIRQNLTKLMLGPTFLYRPKIVSRKSKRTRNIQKDE